MRPQLARLGVMLLPVLIVGCVSVLTPRPLEDDISALRTAEAEWAHALAARDSATLERILAPEFRLVAAGDVTPRAEWLTNTLRHLRVDSVAIFHVKPQVVGDSASVSLEFYWKASWDGRPAIDGTGVLRDTWRRRAGRWVAVQRETLASRPGFAPSPSR